MDQQKTLPFSLTDFPWQQASTAVARARPQRWISHATSAALLVAVVPALVVATGGNHGLLTLSALPIWWFAVGWLVFSRVCRYQRKVYYQTFTTSPHRAGLWTATLTEDGLTYDGFTGTAHYPWATLHAILAVKGGLAILLNPLEYLPISAAGFPDPSARDAFLKTAQASIAAAKEPAP